MSKLSQRELLDEGFLDLVRKSADVARKSASAIKGAAKSIGKDFLTMNPNANLFASAASGLKQGWKEAADSPEGFVEREVTTKWSQVFDPRSIKITKKEKAAPAANRSFELSKVNRFFVFFKGNRYKRNGGVESAEYKAAINRGTDGKFVLEDIFDLEGNKIDRMSALGRARANRQTPPSPPPSPSPSPSPPPSPSPSPSPPPSPPPTTTPSPSLSATPSPPSNNKPKFTEALRDWKINNIGPSAATVGINYQQAKAFLKSLNVSDPNRVLSQAGIQDQGRIISNRQLADIEFTLRSRNIVECTQLDTLRQFDILFF